MNKFLGSKLFYLLASFLFALLLFFNANSTNIRNTGGNTVGRTDIYTATIHNVPVQLQYDEYAYYVYDFVPQVDVFIQSNNRVRLDSEVSEATRSFTVSADLTNHGPGTYDIPLRLIGLDNAITGQIEPNVITVTIDQRETKTFPVHFSFQNSQVERGFEVDSSGLEPTEVEVTTGSKIMEQIDRIEAVLPEDIMLTHDYTGDLPLRAVDANGQQLNVIFNVPTVRADITLLSPSKHVSLVVVQSGVLPHNVASYTFSIRPTSVTVFGTLDVLAGIDVLRLPIDITNITTQQTITVPLSQGTFTAQPASALVTVTPVLNTDEHHTSETTQTQETDETTTTSEED